MLDWCYTVNSINIFNCLCRFTSKFWNPLKRISLLYYWVLNILSTSHMWMILRFSRYDVNICFIALHVFNLMSNQTLCAHSSSYVDRAFFSLIPKSIPIPIAFYDFILHAYSFLFLLFSICTSHIFRLFVKNTRSVWTIGISWCQNFFSQTVAWRILLQQPQT